MSAKRIRLILALIVCAVVVLLVRAALKPPAVQVVRPVKRDVLELVVATGYVRPGQETSLGAEIAGTVENVFVKEDDSAAQGRVLLVLRRRELDDQVAQLRRSLERARRELDKARRPAYPEDLAAARADLERAQLVNKALLDAARERLNRLETGGRTEEKLAAAAELRKARAARENAENDLSRAQKLYDSGAISLTELDRRRLAAEQARAGEESARQHLRLAEEPARPEEIAAARAEVRAAEATMRTSVQAARARLDNLLRQPRSEDVRIAQARVEESAAALRQAESTSEKTVLRAPFAGVITKRAAEPGQSVNPGQTLLTMADMSRPEIRVETDEINLPRLRVGQTATVFAPSYRDKPFKATLTRIGPRVDKNRGVVELELRPIDRPAYIRPEMTVDVNLETARLPSAIALPASAVLQENGADQVLVVKNGRLARKNVRVRARGTEWIAVSGLSTKSLVVLRAASVKDGQRAKPVEVSAGVR